MDVFPVGIQVTARFLYSEQNEVASGLPPRHLWRWSELWKLNEGQDSTGAVIKLYDSKRFGWDRGLFAALLSVCLLTINSQSDAHVGNSRSISILRL